MIGHGRRTESAEQREIFTRIFETNAWAGSESVSGPGSERHRAARFLPALLDLIKRFVVASVLDAPCGDFNWIAPLADAVGSYVGVDIVPAIIDDNRRRHEAPARRFDCLDFTRDQLPTADLIVCRDALVHLSWPDALAALGNFSRSGSRYLLATTFTALDTNTEIATGMWRPMNLERPPFRLPPPLALIDERRALDAETYGDKHLGLWAVSQFRAG